MSRPDVDTPRIPSPALEALFDEYIAIRDKETRQAFAFMNPRLLSMASIKELLARRESSPSLTELHSLQTWLARDPDSYPIGAGPIEDMMIRQTDPKRIIEICRSDAFQARISPLYLWALARGATTLTRDEDWQKGSYLSLFCAQAALGWEPNGPIHQMVVETLILNIHAAIFALNVQLDDGIFKWMLSAATELLARVEVRHEQGAIGLLCHAIGSLFSDIWIVPGRPEDEAPVEAREWVLRQVADPGLFCPAGDPLTLPPPAESLRVAIAWYERALPFRAGLQRGLTYKAIAQTVDFAKRVLHENVDEALFTRCMALAPELLEKHPDTSHLEFLASIAAVHGMELGGPGALLSAVDHQLLSKIRTDEAFDDAAGTDVARQRESHDAALHDLERVLRHGLPWVLCLRNFDYANEYFRLGDDIVTESEGIKRIVVPVIRYSLVDHKILELFPEGAIAIADTRTHKDPRLTPIPMLSLGARWIVIAEALMIRSTRIVMLMDSLTPGISVELDLLSKLNATARTLIVTGHHYRETGESLHSDVTSRFPHVVDWIDFGFDESHPSERYKAHGIIAGELGRYVRSDARHVVKAWIDGID